jgi:hypothetical protein
MAARCPSNSGGSRERGLPPPRVDEQRVLSKVGRGKPRSLLYSNLARTLLEERKTLR